MERIVLQPIEMQPQPRKKPTYRRRPLVHNGVKSTITESLPTVPSSKTPILHIPGWGMGEGSYTHFSQSMAEQGYPLLFIKNLSKRRGYTDEGFSLIHVTRAQNMLDALQQQAISEVNIIAHSEGAIVGALLALQSVHQPIKVKNIVFVSPGGLTGKERPTRFAIRFLKHALEITRKDRTYAFSQEGRDTTITGAKRSLSHPIISLSEVAAIAKSDTVDIIRKLHESGIGIAVIQGDRDKAFPLAEMEINAREAGVDAFYIIPQAMHNVISRDPHFAKYVDRVLTDLEKRKS